MVKLFILICLSQSRLLKGNDGFKIEQINPPQVSIPKASPAIEASSPKVSQPKETSAIEESSSTEVISNYEKTKIVNSITAQIKNKSKKLKNLEIEIDLNRHSMKKIEELMQEKINANKNNAVSRTNEKDAVTIANENNEETKVNEKIAVTRAKEEKKEKEYFLSLNIYNYLFENIIKNDLQNLSKDEKKRNITINDYLDYLYEKYSIDNYYEKKNELENYIKGKSSITEFKDFEEFKEFKELKSVFFEFETNYHFYNSIATDIKKLTGTICLEDCDYFKRFDLSFEDFNETNNKKLYNNKIRQYGNSIAKLFVENLRNEIAMKSIKKEIKILEEL